MIRIRGRGAVYGEVWYDEEPSSGSRVDIILYRQRPAPVADAQVTPFLSLVTDLSVDETAITSGFGKEARDKIRRAETRDELCTEFIADPESRLDEFRAFYDAFATQKSLRPCDHKWLVAASQARQLALSSASQHGEALVWHAYVMFGGTAGLLYSGSCSRHRESNCRALIGRANRWHHWKDMQRLRGMGMRRYDWGGIFEQESTPERAGINDFKRGFGGRPVRAYNCSLPVTLKGRIYLSLRNAWHYRLRASHE